MRVFGADWILYLIIISAGNLIILSFLWRSKAIASKVRISLVANLSRAVPLMIPMFMAYMTIIILVDVGVIKDKHHWYMAGSLILVAVQTVGIFSL